MASIRVRIRVRSRRDCSTYTSVLYVLDGSRPARRSMTLASIPRRWRSDIEAFKEHMEHDLCF